MIAILSTLRMVMSGECICSRSLTGTSSDMVCEVTRVVICMSKSKPRLDNVNNWAFRSYDFVNQESPLLRLR